VGDEFDDRHGGADPERERRRFVIDDVFQDGERRGCEFLHLSRMASMRAILAASTVLRNSGMGAAR